MTDDDELWARVSLRITCGDCSVAEISAKLGLESEDKGSEYWAVDLGGDSSIRLDEQLSKARGFLRTHSEILARLGPSNEINLHIGWSPRDPQDGVAFDRELIELLAACRGYVLLDTYQD